MAARYSSRRDSIRHEHYTINHYLPESVKYLLRRVFFMLEPPGPFVQYLGDEERERIVNKLVDLAMKEYTQDIYKSYNIRGFSSARNYTKFLVDAGNARPIVTHNPRPYFKYGSHEREFILKSLKKHTRNFIKHPDQYFENPKDIEKFLYFCRWQKDNPDVFYLSGVKREVTRWEASVDNYLFPEVVRKYTDYFDGNVIYRIINSYMREIDSELYTRDITEANKLRPPEIDFSDSLVLSFSHLDFYKLVFEFNSTKQFFYWLFMAIKQINIRGFNPFDFFAKYFDIVYLFFINHIYSFIVNYIYFIGGFGILGLIMWIGLIIFVERKYRFTYKDIKK